MATFALRSAVHAPSAPRLSPGVWPSARRLPSRAAAPRREPALAVQPPAAAEPIDGSAFVTLVSTALASAETEPAGGWYDSTWDLQQGLEVSEAWPQGLPADLPLDAWLRFACGA
jgi:hypothetical protein